MLKQLIYAKKPHCPKLAASKWAEISSRNVRPRSFLILKHTVSKFRDSAGKRSYGHEICRTTSGRNVDAVRVWAGSETWVNPDHFTLFAHLNRPWLQCCNCRRVIGLAWEPGELLPGRRLVRRHERQTLSLQCVYSARRLQASGEVWTVSACRKHDRNHQRNDVTHTVKTLAACRLKVQSSRRPR